MKRSILNLFLIILGFNLIGCSSENSARIPSPSTFKENFTIGAMVEDNTQYLIPGARPLSGNESGASDQPFTQKHEEMELQIEATDIATFMTAIQSAIEESILDNGASIVGHGSGGVTGSSFSIKYRENEIFGVINVWGIRGEGTTFFIIVLITEGNLNG